MMDPLPGQELRFGLRDQGFEVRALLPLGGCQVVVPVRDRAAEVVATMRTVRSMAGHAGFLAAVVAFGLIRMKLA